MHCAIDCDVITKANRERVNSRNRPHFECDYRNWWLTCAFLDAIQLATSHVKMFMWNWNIILLNLMSLFDLVIPAESFLYVCIITGALRQSKGFHRDILKVTETGSLSFAKIHALLLKVIYKNSRSQVKLYIFLTRIYSFIKPRNTSYTSHIRYLQLKFISAIQLGIYIQNKKIMQHTVFRYKYHGTCVHCKSYAVPTNNAADKRTHFQNTDLSHRKCQIVVILKLLGRLFIIFQNCVVLLYFKFPLSHIFY